MSQSHSRNRGRKRGLWDKVDTSVLHSEKVDSSNKKETKPRTEKERRRQRIRTRILDTCGLIFWTYTLTKIFIIDIDRVIINAIDPTLVPLLDYRLLVYLSILAVLLILSKRIKKKRHVILNVLYVIGYPLILIFWKLPKLAYKHRSWFATFGAINVLATAALNYRYYFVCYLTILLVTLLAFATDSRSILIAAIGALATAVGSLLLRALRLSKQKASFVVLQRTGVETILKAVGSWTTIQKSLKNPRIQRFSKGQVVKIRDKLGIGLAVVNAAHFWAYQIERYHQSGLTKVFALLSYVWLIIEISIIAAVANSALLKLAPNSFSYKSEPGFVELLYYSFNSLYNNEVEVLKPVGTVAIAAKLLTALVGLLIISIVIFYIITDLRNSRRQRDFEEASQAVRAAANTMANSLYIDYEVTPAEAVERLQQLGGAAYLLVVEFLQKRTNP